MITNIRFCPNCGSPLLEGSLFCGECGNRIDPIQYGIVDEEVVEQIDYTQEKIDEAKAEFIKELTTFRNDYPELMQARFLGKEYTPNVEEVIEKIHKHANERYVLPSTPTGEAFVDIIQTTDEVCEESYVITPKYLKAGNVVVNCEASLQALAYESLKTTLFNMLLMLPVGKLKLHVVDLNISLALDDFLAQLPDALTDGQTIKDSLQFIKLLDSLVKKSEATVKRYKDITAQNIEKKTIRQPYEVLVLLDGAAKYKDYYSKIRTLLDQSKNAGIYVVLLTPRTQDLEIFRDATLMTIENLDVKSGLVYPAPIWKDATLREACLNYIRNEAANIEAEQPAKIDLSTMSSNGYADIEAGITVPVGEDMIFKLNTINHVHTFIVGQSGSGKSVFLHNVISSSILQYAPEDLQLYLLDFKLGGVEFNRYKGVKHIKAMLVDNSDQQITLEILRELRNSMAERGKMLRDSGVSNIREYNQEHPDAKMPHILLIADECHEMFRVDDSIPRSVSSEISDIVTKVAKEGRSQGVHLILATQTLSGAEISNEILNNISDHYLLKCAPTDSERLVPGSSDITAMQATGQIYYHHVDEQQQFQAFYTNKEEAAKIITTSIEKAASHPDNGAFYFSGSQIFELEANIMDGNKKIRKMPVVYMGKSIDLKQKDLCINLREDYSENILVFGLNDSEQVTRTSLNLLLSSAMAARMGELDVQIKVMDCLSNDESKYEDMMDELEDSELCEMVTRRKRGDFLKKMAESIKDGSAEPTLIYILGQDRFRELKMDLEFESDDAAPADDFASMLGAFSSSSDSGFKTYRQALNYILDRGPEQGVHTIIQIEKPTNLLFEDLTAKEIFQKFKHLIMLRSDEMTGSRLNLRDDIRLERLSSDSERLRAYYYAEEGDAYTLFTPYEQDGSTKIIKTIEKL